MRFSNSFMGQEWLPRLDSEMERQALAITQSYGYCDLLSYIVAGRGIDVSDASSFLDPKLMRLIPDPYGLRDMEKVSRRLAKAIEAHETVGIFGDYDVDGACSTAIMREFLLFYGMRVLTHIPDRHTEGYGPNTEALKKLAAQGATLLICVDCGANAQTLLSDMARHVDVIVLDHHQTDDVPPENLPLVNPNRRDDLSGLGDLCAAGVVLVTRLAVRRSLRERGEGAPEKDLMSLLDCVALATVADVVPLRGLNRAFVTQGLKIIHRRGRVGLRVLCDAVGIRKPVEASHLGYLIGPRINAGGRIGEPDLGVKLLGETDETQASRIVEKMEAFNKRRQIMEKRALEEAETQARDSIAAQESVLTLASSAWDSGVVGLVASRLKEKFSRPTFVFSLDAQGNATGSGRSVPGVDIGKAVRAAHERGLIEKGGGHAMAAGVRTSQEGLAAFQAFMCETLRETIANAVSRKKLLFDAILTPQMITQEIFCEIMRAGPYGQGNPEPVFVFESLRLLASVTTPQGHVKLTLENESDNKRLQAIVFRAQGTPLESGFRRAKGKRIHIAGSLLNNVFRGRETLEARVIDAAPAME